VLRARHCIRHRIADEQQQRRRDRRDAQRREGRLEIEVVAEQGRKVLEVERFHEGAHPIETEPSEHWPIRRLCGRRIGQADFDNDQER
jgi:hypothetical protein